MLDVLLDDRRQAAGEHASGQCQDLSRLAGEQVEHGTLQQRGVQLFRVAYVAVVGMYDPCRLRKQRPYCLFDLLDEASVVSDALRDDQVAEDPPLVEVDLLEGDAVPGLPEEPEQRQREIGA